MRKLAIAIGALLALGGGVGVQRALATQATVTVDPATKCANVTAVVDGTPVNVNQTQCLPATGTASSPVPPLPTIPVPQLPPPAQLPPPPDLPTLPTVPAPIPNLPNPLPGVSPPGPSAATALSTTGGLCNYDSVRPSPPPAGEQTVTLPDGTTIYHHMNGTSGYTGGTNPAIGTLEGGGSVSTSGVTGQIDGNNVQTGLSGYLGTNGACLGK